MAIENTILNDEISVILTKGSNPVHSQWKCTVHTPDADHTPVKFFSIDIERRYDKNFSDFILVDLVFGMGTYNDLIYPFKDQLSITLTRIPTGELEAVDDDNSDIYSRRFRAIITDEKSHTVEATNYTTQNKETADLANFKRIELQLMEVALEEIRLRETGGIYRYNVPGDVVKYVLTHTSADLELPDEDKILGVDMVDYDNQTPFDHVIIPHGTKLQDVPAYIQDNWGGVYSTGIGCYLQDGLWYVWPEYSTARFDLEPRNLRIINLPPNRYGGVERTYQLNGEQLVILSTGEVKQLDKSNHDQLNMGSGIRFSHGDRLWDGYGETEDNKHTVDRSKNNTEVNLIERANNTFAPLSSDRISNNTFSQLSKLSKRQGFFINLTWEYSKPELIYPGMPARLVFLRNEEVVEADGIIIRAHHYIHDNKPGMALGRHISNTSLTLFINKIDFES